MVMHKRLAFLAIFVSFFLGLVTVLPPKVAAADCTPGDGQTGVSLTDCFLLNPNEKVADVYSNPSVLINLLLNNIFIIGGFILFVMIMYSGFLYISGSTKGQEQAAKVLTTAVVGFIVMFSAFWILQIIQVVTGADLRF
jgi:hypothetical protein